MQLSKPVVLIDDGGDGGGGDECNYTCVYDCYLH